MTTRSRLEEVVFRHPFQLSGWTESQPAGAYSVETEEELLEALSFPAWRRVATILTRRPGPGVMVIEAFIVDPRSLAAALAADAAMPDGP